MAMQTPVLSILIQDMCFSDVIFMSRHKNFENFMLYHDKFLCYDMSLCPYVVQHYSIRHIQYYPV